MTVTFGYYSLLGIATGTMLPVLVALLVWSVRWFQIRTFNRQPMVEGEVRHLPRHLLEMLFSGQHYPFMLLQPLDWAFPWVLVVLFYGLPAGVLLDNGFTIGWWTLGMGVLVCIAGTVYVMRIADEFTLRNPPWWLQTPAVMTMVLLALLCGVALDTWLI